jgi:hypothetical protein
MGDTLSVLDAQKNVLFIDRAKYDRLDEINKHILLRTHHTTLDIDRRGRPALPQLAA